jgi:hypothetical protein
LAGYASPAWAVHRHIATEEEEKGGGVSSMQ